MLKTIHFQSRHDLTAVFLGSLIACIAFAQSDQPLPPPGQLVQVNGHEVHIDCAGRGSPAVVLLHGLGDYSFDWKLVQPEIARSTQTCAYDRPGQAWSAPGAAPRGLRTSATELRELLRKAGVSAPYMLVGHSWGGLIARMYAYLYPTEVAGMVLVDSAHEDEYLWLNGRVIRPSSMSEAEWSDLMKPKKSVAPPAASDSQKPAARRPRITKVS